MAGISEMDLELTRVENEFSYALGEASRWLESLLMVLLLIAVVTVESIGLYLTYRVGRRLSRSLTELNNAAVRVGQGDFSPIDGVNLPASRKIYFLLI